MKTSTDEIVKKSTLTEGDIKLLCRRANNGEKIEFPRLNETGIGYAITQEQTEKGRKWLLNQWKTPRGVERKNNPFGYREQDALNKFKGFEFCGLYDTGNMYHSFYVPIYTVVGENKDGTYTGFQYVLSGGKISIIG